MDYTWKQHSSLGLGYLQYLSAFNWLDITYAKSLYSDWNIKQRQTSGDIWQWLERSFLVATGHCHWKLVDRLGMHPNILQHTGIPSSLPNRELFGLKCQQWWDSEIFNGFDGWMWGGILVFSHSVQGLNPVRLFVTPWTAALQASLFITNSQRLSKLMSIELVMPSNHLILCHPLLLLPSIFPSIRVFSNESTLLIR